MHALIRIYNCFVQSDQLPDVVTVITDVETLVTVVVDGPTVTVGPGMVTVL